MTGGNDTGRAADVDAGPASRRRPGEPSEMETGDGVLAWMILRHVVEYREGWRRHAEASDASAAPESGPFRIRIQTEADLEADRFEMLAWEDPRKADGPASPFWRHDGMPEGVLEPGAEPLAALVGDRGSVEGLRLLGGDLVLKIVYGGAAVQVRLGNAAWFPDDGGISIRHAFGLRIPLSVRRLLDFWSVAGRPAPRNGKGRGGGVREIDRLVTVLAGLGAGKKPRGIAEDIWGETDVAAIWASDSWMRSQVRRWIPKAQALADGGWREFVPRVPAEE